MLIYVVTGTEHWNTEHRERKLLLQVNVVAWEDIGTQNRI